MSGSPAPTHAFVLGAGLGTRLRPLTARRPKPLIPLWHRPLITYAFDHLIRGGVGHLVVNTHWHPEAYDTAFPDHRWHGVPVTLRHEPVLLETAGGIANIADLLPRDRSFWVYNGDILTTLDLQPALDHHLASDDIVTLVLRSSGAETVVAFDPATRRVRDLRNLLATGLAATHQFTGIYLCRPAFLDFLTPGKIESSRTTFLDIIRRTGRLGGVVCDDGLWLDLGDRASYLDAHRRLAPAKAAPAPPGVTLRGTCSVAPDAFVEPGAELEDCVVWPGARAAADARLTRCIVRDGETAAGVAVDRDF
jgi:mannose-1-phosphate guanylyltransferase/mannose-1-phosphate guanylyltransferase/phosphomannomutase